MKALNVREWLLYDVSSKSKAPVLSVFSKLEFKIQISMDTI